MHSDLKSVNQNTMTHFGVFVRGFLVKSQKSYAENIEKLEITKDSSGLPQLPVINLEFQKNPLENISKTCHCIFIYTF